MVNPSEEREGELATARERNRPTRASKAQMGSLKRRVQSAGKQLEQEQEESVLRLARALDEIDEGEAAAYLDARLAHAEREIERLTSERAEFGEAVNSEISLLKVRMQAALEAVGVGPTPEEQGGMAEEIKDSVVADVQATLTRAGDHFAKRFDGLEERWTKTMVDMTSGLDALLKRMAVLERELSEKAEVGRTPSRAQQDERQIADVHARLDKMQVAVEVLAKFAGKPGEVPATYLTRMEALERTVGHLVNWSELQTPSFNEVQTSLDSVLRSVGALDSQMKGTARAQQLSDLQTAVGSLPGMGLRVQALEARLDKSEGPLAAMTSQIYTKLSELVERLEALEVRAAFSTDILPQKRRR